MYIIDCRLQFQITSPRNSSLEKFCGVEAQNISQHQFSFLLNPDDISGQPSPINSYKMATRASRVFRSSILEATYLRPSCRSQLPSIRLKPFSTSLCRSATPATTPTYARKPTPTSAPTASSSPPATKPPSIDDQSPISDLTTGLADEPLILDEGARQVDWTRSFHGLSAQPFSKEAADVLLAPISLDDVECKPDGILYLPEIKYRRILNRAFGPGGWGLAPRGETIVTGKSVTREYALVAHGRYVYIFEMTFGLELYCEILAMLTQRMGSRLVSVARGEQDYFSPEGIPTATEGCKSNALMRCCKDLGVASELWDPRYIRKFMKEQAKQVWVEHVLTKKKKQIWLRKDDEVRYPFKETKYGA
jgi:Mitochondrial genome maintenance MGM101